MAEPPPIDIAAEHAELLAALKTAGRAYDGGEHHNDRYIGSGGDSYTGSGHTFHFVSVPERRRLAKWWLKSRRSAPPETVIALVDRLIHGQSHEEKTLAAILLDYAPRARARVRPAQVDEWLDHLQGWAEIDSLGSGAFVAADLLRDWPAWRGLIERLAGDDNINKRRAALVLLTRPVRTSGDARFADLALAIVDRLRSEKPILITKAVSWLLRSMVERHRERVSSYLDANAASLPAIAVRETRTKLRSGTKSGKPAVPRPQRRT